MQQLAPSASSASPATPAPPSEEERELYYHGLPSCPRFVARSSTHAWVRPRRPEPTMWMGTADMYTKSLRPVGSHPLLRQLWNDAASSLRVQILEAISAADWTAVDILRVGFEEDFPITLMVAVNPETLSWEDGHKIALRCKAILEAHSIDKVHCEIRESVVRFCTEEASRLDSMTDSAEGSTTHSTTDPMANPTANPTANPMTDPMTDFSDFSDFSDPSASSDSPDSSDNPTAQMPATFRLSAAPVPVEDYFAEMYANISDCLGTRIAMKHMDSITGTKGLYLSLLPSVGGGEAKIVALTCRHVVINTKTESLKKYRRPKSGPFKDVIQVDQPMYERMVRTLERKAREYRERDGEGSNSSQLSPASASSAMTLQQNMRPFVAASSRAFGQLLFSPRLATAKVGGGKWLRDWALIELLPDSHKATLGSIKNKVFIGKTSDCETIVKNYGRGWEGLPEPKCPKLVDGFVELQKVAVPMDEILNPKHTDRYFDQPAMLVAKYGALGGLTLGFGNTLKSVIREIETPRGKQCASEVWPIISILLGDNRQQAFSVEGDSGSIVWDMNQRPAGIIMGGINFNRLNDVTYAQPLGLILEDIESCCRDVKVSLV
ncbi:hypothetical protein GGI35DRAFT_472888 [Trichoderma velutinum]